MFLKAKVDKSLAANDMFAREFLLQIYCKW